AGRAARIFRDALTRAAEKQKENGSGWLPFHKQVIPTGFHGTLGILIGLLLTSPAFSQTELTPLLQRHWFEARTAHFNIYSCGSNQAVAKVGGRLEQFREAYASLAGAQAVASPPIIVVAFPDHQSMEPFLRLYQGKPANLAAFFLRGSDENFIALYLSG